MRDHSSVAVSTQSFPSLALNKILAPDDETALWAAGSLEKLGTIEVRAVRIHKHKRAVAFKPYPFQGVDAVHERSKKLGAHCVT